MKEISTDFPDMLSNEVLNEIKNTKNPQDIVKDIKRQGIEIKRKVIQKGEELIITEGKYYNLNDFESKIKNEDNLKVKPKDIMDSLSILGHQGVFAGAIKAMAFSAFIQDDILKKQLYKGYKDYQPLDGVVIGNHSLNISLIIDESDLKKGKKVYLEMDAGISEQIGKSMLNSQNKNRSFLGNLIYTFDLQNKTFQSKITSDNPNLTEEQLGKILKISSTENELFKSDKEKLNDILKETIIEIKNSFININKQSLAEISNNVVNYINDQFEKKFNISKNDSKQEFSDKVQDIIEKLNNEINEIFKKNNLNTKSVLEDLFKNNEGIVIPIDNYRIQRLDR